MSPNHWPQHGPTYRVAEFADMSGVTVRTLQYYDRIGLLKPTATTEGGHRLYVRGDLVRLQQILTLKWMGFSLDDIKAILESPTYDLHESLVIQKAAVEAQLARLREASAALDVAIDAAQALSEDDVDSETVSAIIRAVLAQNENEWVRRYYNDEAWLAIQTRQLSFTPDDQAKAEREWHAIYTAFDAVRDQPPDSDAAQEIAAKMMALGLQFTKGDPQIEAGLRQFVHDAGDGKLPPELKHYAPFAGVDDDLRRFIQFAMEIYQERAKK